VLAGAPYHQKFLSHSPESYPKLGGAVNGAVSHESRAGSAEPGIDGSTDWRLTSSLPRRHLP
jgi:hypothetical protein